MAMTLKCIQRRTAYTFNVVGGHAEKRVCKECSEVQEKSAACQLRREQECLSTTKWQWT